MSSEVRIGRQVALYDRDATIALYANTIKVAGADECSCTGCKNFAAQRTTAYPNEFLGVLNQLGVDQRKELEAFDYDFGFDEGDHLYGGWFVFCGRLLEGTNWRPEQHPAPFKCWFTNSFPHGGLPRDAQLCVIEFCAQLPWIIPEAPDEPSHNNKKE